MNESAALINVKNTLIFIALGLGEHHRVLLTQFGQFPDICYFNYFLIIAAGNHMNHGVADFRQTVDGIRGNSPHQRKQPTQPFIRRECIL